MKNFTKVFAVLAGLTFSSLAFSQVSNEIGSLTSSGSIAPADCTVLGTTTKIKLSSSSMITYKCSPFYNQIVMMSCNSAGSRTPSTIDCQFVADAEGSVEWPTGSTTMGDWNDAQCTAETDADGVAIQVDIVGGETVRFLLRNRVHHTPYFSHLCY